MPFNIEDWASWSIRPEIIDKMLVDLNDQAKVKSTLYAVTAEKAAGPQLFAYDDDDRPYTITENGVAIIPIIGPLTKRGGFMSFFFNGTSYQKLEAMIDFAINDDAAQAILLDVDSPGGTVSGTDAFTDLIKSASDTMPVVAFASGTMCSAAYWISSAADVIVSERTAAIGSIGVMTVHADFSKMDARAGVKYTVLKAGKYKAVGNDYEPLTDEDRRIIQAELDTVYDIFIQTVAENRGVDEDKVRSQMAEGKVFIGHAAKDVGLVDKVGTKTDALMLAGKMAADDIRPYMTIQTGATAPNKETMIMPKDKQIMAPTTVQELEAAFPELAKELRDQGAASVDTKPAVSAETTRMLGLVAAHFGADAGETFKKIVDAGVTEEQYKAIVGDTAPGMPKAQDTTVKDKDQVLSALAESGAKNPGADNGSQDYTGKDYMALVSEYKAAHKCDSFTAQMAVTREHPDAKSAYLKKIGMLN